MLEGHDMEDQYCSCRSSNRKRSYRRSLHSTSHLPLLLSERFQSQSNKHKQSDTGLTFALQALLDRHEAYVRESQAEQARLSSHVSKLENEKATLQQNNHKMIVENRELLQKLEQLNTEFSNKGDRVRELEIMLHDCEEDLARYNSLTRKTQELERHVGDIEREREQLAKDLDEQKSESRSTIARWRDSERRIRELEQEVKKIELAARLDRANHEDVVARIDRDRALQREMGLSEGRLKATAAIQTMQHGGVQKQVVSNFVRDILQDNANLQTGIAELKELLQTSNDEVQMLREQIMLHQPLEEDVPPIPQRTVSLSDELGLTQSLPQKQAQQELHVHHHYHTKVGGKKEKPVGRRTPRKRALLLSGGSSPSPSESGRSTPVLRPQRLASSPAVPVSARPTRMDRWSMQSTATTSTYVSSIASSPTSWHDRTSSIFDRIDHGEESSRPTSPESFAISSPLPFKRRIHQEDLALSVFEEEVDLDPSEVISPLDTRETAVEETAVEDLDDNEEDTEIPTMDLTPKASMMLGHERRSFTSEESAARDLAPEPDPPPTKNEDSQARTVGDETDIVDDDVPIDDKLSDAGVSGTNVRPSRGRSNSHESLFSLSGMDIHLPQQSSRTTLALLHGHGVNKHHFAPSPAAIQRAPASTSQPLAAVTEYTATSKGGVDATTSPSMQALSGLRSQVGRSIPAQAQGRGLMGSVGGWMSSRWKAPSTMKSIADLRSAAAPPSAVSAPKPALVKFASLSTSSGANIAPPSVSNFSTSSGQRSVSASASPMPMKRPSDQLDQSTTLSSSFLGRAPGINQSGPIPGLAAALAAKRTPTTVDPRQVDITGLKESLTEQ